MGIHPLTPRGIDETTLDYWQQYFDARSERSCVEERNANARVSEEDLKKLDRLKELLLGLEKRFRSRIRDLLDQKEIDAALIAEVNGDGTETGKIAGCSEWMSDNDRKRLIDDLLEWQHDQMQIFFLDQQILRHAILSVGHVGGALRAYAGSPSGTIDDVLQLLPLHPRFRLHVERYALRAYRDTYVRKTGRMLRQKNVREEALNAIAHGEVLDECLERRDAWCRQSRAQETGLRADDIGTREDVEYESRRIEQWLRKPVRGWKFAGAVLRLLCTDRPPAADIPELLTAKTRRPPSSIREYEPTQ